MRGILLSVAFIVIVLAPTALAGCNPSLQPITSANYGTAQFTPVVLGKEEHVLHLYPEAQGPSAGPFLSLSPDSSTPSFNALAATAGAASTVDSFRGERGGRVEFKLDAGLPARAYLNLSKPIVGNLYWSSTAAATVQRDPTWLRVELFVDGKRLGGDEYIYPAALSRNTWYTLPFCFRSELPSIPAGAPISFRVSRLHGAADFMVGTHGAQQSYIEVHYFRTDPLAGALYVDRDTGQLVVGGSNGTADPGGESVASAGWPLSLVGGLLLAAPLGRRPRAALLVSLLVATTGLAGCFGGAPASAPTSSVPVQRSYDEDLAKKGVGVIEGRVLDPTGLPIRDASADLVGTSVRTSTDALGSFRMLDLAPRRYELRVDADNFVPSTVGLLVEAGYVTSVNVTLERPAEGSADLRPHVHDDWQGETSIRIFEGEVRVPSGEYCLYYVDCQGDIVPERPILPGAIAMEVKASWTATVGFTEMALSIQTATNRTANQEFVPRRSGDPFRIAFFPTEADPGHQKFSSWRLGLRTGPDRTNLHPMPDPIAPPVQVHVEITITKGPVVPLEPPHRTFWGTDSARALVNNEPRVGVCAPCDYPRHDPLYMWSPSGNVLVPPGTKELRGYLAWANPAGAPAGTEWRLAYHPGNLRPNSAASADYGSNTFLPATMEGTGQNRSFVIRVEEGESDQYYQRVSNWAFYVDDGVEPLPGLTNANVYYAPTTGRDTTWRLTVWAVRDPQYSEETTSALPPQVDAETGAVAGTVLSDQKVALFNVEVALGSLTTKTDPAGRFSLSHVSPGAHELKVRRTGYANATIPVNVTVGEVTRLTVVLKAEDRPLPYQRTIKRTVTIAAGEVFVDNRVPTANSLCRECEWYFSVEKGYVDLLVEVRFTNLGQSPPNDDIWLDFKTKWTNTSTSSSTTEPSVLYGYYKTNSAARAPAANVKLLAAADTVWLHIASGLLPSVNKQITVYLSFGYVDGLPPGFTGVT